MNWPVILLHLWLVPAAFLYGSCFYTRPSLRDALRCGLLMAAWPVTFPAIWLINRLTR